MGASREIGKRKREFGGVIEFAFKKKSHVLTVDKVEIIENLYSEGNSVKAISEHTGIDYSTIKKGVSRGLIRLQSPSSCLSPLSTASSRNQDDAHQQMGNACSNVVERASKGTMTCPVEFENQLDLRYGGLLIALPSLISCGILNGISRFDLPKVYYNTTQIFLSLAFMVLLRVKRIEQSKMLSCGELGRCLGMDRVPGVQTLRNRLSDYSAVSDVGEWSLDLSRYWMKQNDIEGVLYVDGHVNIYYGKSVEMPSRYVSRMRLCMSGSTDYWVNDALGQPYFVVHKTINEGMIKCITAEIIPELDKSVPNQPTEAELEKNPQLHRYMLVFDREGYSVPFFRELKEKRIAFCTYRKNVKDKWDINEFEEYTTQNKSGESLKLKLAEHQTYLKCKREKGKEQEGIFVREIRKLTESGHQTSIITTNYVLSITDIGIYMFSRWCQENYFKYAMENFGIDALISNTKKSIPDTYNIPNPDYVALNQEHKSIAGKLAKQKQKLAEKQIEIDQPELEEKRMKKFILQKAEILQSVELYKSELEEIKQKKKTTAKRVDFKKVYPDKENLTVINDQRQLLETIKMIGFHAEDSLANHIRPMMANEEQAKMTIKSIYQSAADLKVDKQNNKLYVLLHHNNFAHLDAIVNKLFVILNETETKFPGSNLTICYKLVSDKFQK